MKPALSDLQSPSVKPSTHKPSNGPAEPVKPMKPHRGLLILFSFLLALWIAMMCVMYVGVYKQRHPRQSPVSSVPVAPSPAR